MIATNGYPTKKVLKACIGTPLRYVETSMFGPEFVVNKPLTVVGPSAYERKWFATVVVNEQGQLVSVK